VALCDACKRREAVYLRTYSGQKLCKACLRRTLERAVRKAVSEAGGLPPRSRIVIPVIFTAPHLSLALLDVAAKVERRFGSEIIALVPDEIEIFNPSLLNDIGVNVIRLSVSPPKDASLSECLRFDVAWSAHVASSIGANAVLLPITLTDRILVALDSLIHGRVWLISDSIISRNVSTVKVVYAFGTIEGETAAAYVAIARMGMAAWSPCKVRSPSKRVFYSVAYKRPELEYSAFKTISKLSKLARHGVTCNICGGLTFSRGGESVCPICERLKPTKRINFKPSR